MNDLVMDDEDAEMAETFALLGPVILRAMQKQPNKRQRPADEQGQTTGQNGQLKPLLQLMGMMSQLLLRHDRELASQRCEDTFLFFMQVTPQGALTLLIQEATKWKKAKEDHPQTTQHPLRCHLAAALFQLLVTRLKEMHAQGAQGEIWKEAVKNHLLHPDGSWPFMKWCHQRKMITINDSKPALSMQTMVTMMTELTDQAMLTSNILRFHSLKPTATSGIVPWKLQVTVRDQTMFGALQKLAHSAIWSVVACTMKPHSEQQSKQALQMQQLASQAKLIPKGKGKGKTKGKTE